jgi:hypothetical protein
VILDLGASDGVFYRAQVFPDLTVKGYTRNSPITLRPEDLRFSGRISRTNLMRVLRAIESTGFNRLSSALVEQEALAASGGTRHFASDRPSTYVRSRVRGHEFDVSVYDVRGKRQRHPELPSLETADRAGEVILEQVQWLMKLPGVRTGKMPTGSSLPE